MPRPPRRCMPDTTYHVYSRCIEWKCLMADCDARDLMLYTLKRTQRKYRFDLIFYEIMDSHFHLVIKTLRGEATISRIMQYFKARYAEAFNRKVERIGPFWNERFKDTIADEEPYPSAYVLRLLWYLAYNPVRKKMAFNPREYRHGSIRQYLDSEKPGEPGITRHAAFLSLGSTQEARIRRFLLFEEEYLLRDHDLRNPIPKGQSP
jgi:putative transposase